MNSMCDVYTYESVNGGWITHVASNRRIVPPIPDILFCDFSIYLIRWSGSYLDKTLGRAVYPSAPRRAVSQLWLSFCMLWRKLLHNPSMSLIPRKNIGLKFDGETFTDASAGECADTLCMLRSAGYRIPQYAIDDLRKEAMEEAMAEHGGGLL
jgi:hypothetical protein